MRIVRTKKKTGYFTTTKFGLGYQILRPTFIGIIKHETAYYILFSLNTWYYLVWRDDC